jgi:uncharacterized protein YacL
MRNKPDNFEKGIRFGCGGLIGLFVGLYVSANFFLTEDKIIAFILTVIITICFYGFIAMKLGNKFWFTLRNWLPF